MATVGTPGAIRKPPPNSGLGGQGVSYPLDYTTQGRLKLSYGEASINEALISIGLTVAGERSMLPACGSNMGVHEPIDLARFKAKYRLDVREYEPRVDTIEVETELGDQPQQALVHVTYTTLSDATDQTLTFPLFTGP